MTMTTKEQHARSSIGCSLLSHFFIAKRDDRAWQRRERRTLWFSVWKSFLLGSKLHVHSLNRANKHGIFRLYLVLFIWWHGCVRIIMIIRRMMMQASKAEETDRFVTTSGKEKGRIERFYNFAFNNSIAGLGMYTHKACSRRRSFAFGFGSSQAFG